CRRSPVKLAAAMPPKKTMVPVMASTVPPPVLPLVVAMVLLDDAVATLPVKRSNDDRADEPARVLSTSQTPAVCGGVPTVSCVETLPTVSSQLTSTPPKVTVAAISEPETALPLTSGKQGISIEILTTLNGCPARHGRRAGQEFINACFPAA